MENEIHKDNIKLLEVLYQGNFVKLGEDVNWKHITKVTLINYEFCIVEFYFEQYELHKYELI